MDSSDAFRGEEVGERRTPAPLEEGEVEEDLNSDVGTVFSEEGGRCKDVEDDFEDDAVADNGEESSLSSESDDDGSEKCPICLQKFTDQEIGSPEMCEHHFCLRCITAWSKKVATCPIDRKFFSTIIVKKDLDGKVIRIEDVNFPNAQVNEEEYDSSPTYCEVCGRCDREDRLLLCDGCDLGYHLECLEPPMEYVPIEDWFCPTCISQGINNNDDEVQIIASSSSGSQQRRGPTQASNRIPRTLQNERILQAIEPALPVSTQNAVYDVVESLLPCLTDRTQSSSRSSSSLRRTRRIKRTSSKVGSRRRKGRSRRKTRRRRRVAVDKRPNTARARIAHQLGIMRPLPGQVYVGLPPACRSSTATSSSSASASTSASSINNLRYNAGIPSLRLFGASNDLSEMVDSGSEDEQQATFSQSGDRHPSSQRLNKSCNLETPNSSNTEASSSSTCDILGGILKKQHIFLHDKNMKIGRDGSLVTSLNVTDIAKAVSQKPGELQQSATAQTNTPRRVSASSSSSISSSIVGGSNQTVHINSSQHTKPYEEKDTQPIYGRQSSYTPTFCESQSATLECNDDSLDVYSDIEEQSAVFEKNVLTTDVSSETKTILEDGCKSTAENSEDDMVIDEDGKDESTPLVLPKPHTESNVIIEKEDYHLKSSIETAVSSCAKSSPDPSEDLERDHAKKLNEKSSVPEEPIKVLGSKKTCTEEQEKAKDVSDSKDTFEKVKESKSDCSEKIKKFKFVRKGCETGINSDSIAPPTNEHGHSSKHVIQFSIPKRHNVLPISSLIKRKKGVMKKDAQNIPQLNFSTEVSKMFASQPLEEPQRRKSITDVKKPSSVIAEIFGFDEDTEEEEEKTATSAVPSAVVSGWEVEVKEDLLHTSVACDSKSPCRDMKDEENEASNIAGNERNSKESVGMKDVANSWNTSNEKWLPIITSVEKSEEIKQESILEGERTPTNVPEKDDEEIEIIKVVELQKSYANGSQDVKGDDDDVKIIDEFEPTLRMDKKSKRKHVDDSRSSENDESRNRSPRRSLQNRQDDKRDKRSVMSDKEERIAYRKRKRSNERKEANKRGRVSSGSRKDGAKTIEYRSNTPSIHSDSSGDSEGSSYYNRRSTKYQPDFRFPTPQTQYNTSSLRHSEYSSKSPSKSIDSSASPCSYSRTSRRDLSARESAIKENYHRYTDIKKPHKKGRKERDILKLRTRAKRLSEKRAHDEERHKVSRRLFKEKALEERKREKKRRKREKSLPPVKEVVASGDNIVVNLNFQNSSLATESHDEDDTKSTTKNITKAEKHRQTGAHQKHKLESKESVGQDSRNRMSRGKKSESSSRVSSSVDGYSKKPKDNCVNGSYENVKDPQQTNSSAKAAQLNNCTSTSQHAVTSIADPPRKDTKGIGSEEYANLSSQIPAEVGIEAPTSQHGRVVPMTGNAISTQDVLNNPVLATVATALLAAGSVPNMFGDIFEGHLKTKGVLPSFSNKPQPSISYKPSQIKRRTGGGDSPASPDSNDGDGLFDPPIDPAKLQTRNLEQNESTPTKQMNCLLDSLFGKDTGTPKRPNVKSACRPSKPGSTKQRNVKKLFGSHPQQYPTREIDTSKLFDANLNDVPGSAVQLIVQGKLLQKLNRQERVVEEVKLCLKPHYIKKHIDKEAYKEILRRSVPKICHSKTGEINPVKVREMIEAYVKKFWCTRKKS